MKFVISLFSILLLSFGASLPAFAAESAAVKESSGKVESVVPQFVVNINTADIEELTKLKGIGEKKAEAILAWRKANGDFKSVDQLLEVKGIGEATLAANRKNIRI
jgi:competence protein ComEA